MSTPIESTPTTTPSQPASAPSGPAPSVTPGAGGVSAPGTTPQGGSAGGNMGSLRGDMHAAAGTTAAAGSSPSPAPGGAVAQPAIAGAAPAQAAPTVEQLQSQLQAMREQQEAAMQWAHYGRQQYMQAQRAAQAPQTQQPGQQPQIQGPKKNIFGIPEFDLGLLRFFKEGPDGELQPTPYAPPDAYYQYQQWSSAMRDAQTKFWQDPTQYLKPLLEQLIDERAPKAAQSQIQQHQQVQFAQGYVQQNAAWLYSKGQDGQVARDMFGQPQLSAAGKLFAETVNNLHAQGIRDPYAQQQIAEEIVLGRLALAQQNQAASAHQQAAAGKANVLAQGNMFTPGGPATQPSSPIQQPLVPPPDAPIALGRRLRGEMMDAARAAGLPVDTLA